MYDQEGRNPPCQADKQADEGEGDRPLTPSARGPIPEEGGDPFVRQRALPAHGMPGLEGGILRSQREAEEEGAPPEQRALPAHGMHGRGGPLIPTNNQRDPPEQRAPQAHGVQIRGGEIGAGTQPEGEGGTPPEKARTPVVRGLNQEMGGNSQDLRGTPPNVIQSGGGGGEARQARAIGAGLILDTPGGRPT